MHESKWSTEKKYEIVLRSLRGETIADLCRENGMSETMFYRWWDEFLQGAQQGLNIIRIQTQSPALQWGFVL